MRSRLLTVSFAFLLLPATLGACGGPGAVGEPCERPGTSEDCVEGAVCATDETPEGASSDPVWESYTCRAICRASSDCPPDLECRGVAGAAMVSACQPMRTR